MKGTPPTKTVFRDRAHTHTTHENTLSERAPAELETHNEEPEGKREAHGAEE